MLFVENRTDMNGHLILRNPAHFLLQVILRRPPLSPDYHSLRAQRTPPPPSFPLSLLFLIHFSSFPAFVFTSLAQGISSPFPRSPWAPFAVVLKFALFLLSTHSISESSSHRSLTLMPMSTFSTSSSSDASERGHLERYLRPDHPNSLPQSHQFLPGPRRPTQADT